ncbi:MAG: 3-phosphoshikimate 1-carboxyvinyltransferase [Acidimicrobiia bacterium]
MIITPLRVPPDTTVVIPGSKSFTNRALVCAALADGVSVLTGALAADDTEAMIGCLRALGVSIDIDVAASAIMVNGCGGVFPNERADLDVRQSGTTARFVLPLLAAGHGRYRLDAAPQMRARPMGALIDAVRSLGAAIDEHGEPGHLPLTVVADGLHGNAVALPGNTTSQFLSGLLLAAPYSDTGIAITLTSELVSRPYVDMTRSVMADFGVRVGDDLVVPVGRYRARTYAIEPDASGASYFFAAAAITGGRIRIEGLGSGSGQGDIAFVEVLRRMGAAVEQTPTSTTVVGGPLRGIDVDMREISDTVPTLAVVAAFASTPTRISGVGFIRNKESDRIDAVVTELRRCGVDAVENADGMTITPAPIHSATVQTYDDHRMAMAFALLGLVRPGIDIADPGCVAKTFPTYWRVLEELRRP